jgi:transposase InsO family protein
MTTDRPLELLHMDLFGPIAYISISGSKYCLVVVDDYSRFTWVFFLQDKSQTQETLKGFLRRAQNEFDLRIKKIRSDNGTKFKNSQIEGFLEDEGIKHEFSSCRCFGSDRTPGVAPRGVFRSRTMLPTVARWFVLGARETVNNDVQVRAA